MIDPPGDNTGEIQAEVVAVAPVCHRHGRPRGRDILRESWARRNRQIDQRQAVLAFGNQPETTNNVHIERFAGQGQRLCTHVHGVGGIEVDPRQPTLTMVDEIPSSPRRDYGLAGGCAGKPGDGGQSGLTATLAQDDSIGAGREHRVLRGTDHVGHCASDAPARTGDRSGIARRLIEQGIADVAAHRLPIGHHHRLRGECDRGARRQRNAADRRKIPVQDEHTARNTGKEVAPASADAGRFDRARCPANRILGVRQVVQRQHGRLCSLVTGREQSGRDRFRPAIGTIHFEPRSDRKHVGVLQAGHQQDAVIGEDIEVPEIRRDSAHLGPHTDDIKHVESAADPIAGDEQEALGTASRLHGERTVEILSIGNQLGDLPRQHPAGPLGRQPHRWQHVQLRLFRARIPRRVANCRRYNDMLARGVRRNQAFDLVCHAFGARGRTRDRALEQLTIQADLRRHRCDTDVVGRGDVQSEFRAGHAEGLARLRQNPGDNRRFGVVHHIERHFPELRDVARLIDRKDRRVERAESGHGRCHARNRIAAALGSNPRLPDYCSVHNDPDRVQIPVGIVHRARDIDRGVLDKRRVRGRARDRQCRAVRTSCWHWNLGVLRGDHIDLGRIREQLGAGFVPQQDRYCDRRSHLGA